jgi:hypothetical protein
MTAGFSEDNANCPHSEKSTNCRQEKAETFGSKRLKSIKKMVNPATESNCDH